MQRIALNKAAPGMILAQAVCRSEGPVLVGEGVTLTESIIDRIRATGTATVWVEGNPLGAEGDVGNLRIVAERLPHLFRRVKDDVFMMTLCNVFARHFARRMAEQQAAEDAAIERGKNGEDGGDPETGAFGGEA